MTRLSVNLNKVALIRNAREDNSPSIVEAAIVAIAAGCHGLTIHPRADQRHALLSDIVALAALEQVQAGRIELNVEGDIRRDLLAAALAAKVHQFTFVPVTPGERTSRRGWRTSDDLLALQAAVSKAKTFCRTSVFLDPDPERVAIAIETGADAVEFYMADFAQAYAKNDYANELQRIKATALLAREYGLRVHLGHDLDLKNLPLLIKEIKPDEVSIGHALISDAVMVGLAAVVPMYVASSALI